MTTTAYLDLFLRSISEPALLQSFLSFVLLHTHDNVHVLDTLVSRVNTPFQLGTVSLALFRTLIGFFCEDVMLQLVFRYLIPCSHLSRKQRSSLKQTDCYSTSAASFLLLLPSWCPGSLLNADLHSEHIHWPKGADLSVSERVGDSVEDEDEIARRVESDSICSLVVTPPPSALSPTPSSSDTVATGDQPGRAGSALELEWDDIFADDDPSSSAFKNTTAANDRCAATPLPPRHIQEMQRTATKLVHGSYVEESEFEDDVLVYDLVAQRETKAAILERIVAANRRARGSVSNSRRTSTTATTTTTLTSMLTTTGRTVMETVNSIMSTRRMSEDGGKEERRSEDLVKEVRSSEDVGRRTEGEEIERIDAKGDRQFFTNGFNAKNDIIDERDDSHEDADAFNQNCNLRHFPNTVNHTLHEHNTHPAPCLGTLPNGHSESEPSLSRPSVADVKSQNLPGNNVADNDDFLSRYHELMLSLGVEPDCDDTTSDIRTFRRRVRALRQRLEEEEEFALSSSWEDGEEEEEEEEMDEVEEEEEEEEEERSSSSPFISVLLSRLENLLENSIAVNLLVTGILAQLAWRFLLAKDQDSKFREGLQSQGRDLILDPSLSNGSVSNALALPPLAVLPPCPHIPPQAKSRVFAIILFAEFLKELAAIAQEHSVAPDRSSEDQWE
ncbi:hypothetical protein FQN60_006437 [Etheostoma spectabile]|uniref:FHF complex subunit HOOK-interacting protein C-terminal domain-containing protein n=1 Tax=Etheostoma spectabile TaxID=54343 RepID=A0A5J5CQ64_9PERO|nr:hypothetical protein FQN60_006437 [Etheostoma spectabile]